MTDLACPETSHELVDALAADYRLEELPPLHVTNVLDIGAHVGGFARYALRVWPKATIFSVEPHPANYAALTENARGRSIIPLRSAVLHPASQPFVKLYEGKNGSHEASTRDDVRWPHLSQDLTRWSMVPTIDASALASADVLKIDTEGSEVEILTGYRYLRDVRVLLVEPHAVRGDYAAQSAHLRAIASAAGFTELPKGIALRFLRK